MRYQRGLWGFFFVFSLIPFAQGQSTLEQIADSITREGKNLYNSEWTSWYGTDVFLSKFKETDKIGGYISFQDHDKLKCVFYSKGDSPSVIGCVSFDTLHEIKSANADLTPRPFGELEFTLYRLRKTAKEAIRGDTLFKTYQHTEYNMIPVVQGQERKVVILTGPQENGVVIMGNDYVLNFDSEYHLLNRKRFHHNILIFKFGPEQKQDVNAEGGIHSHLPETSEFITPTDICTLMLYEKMAKWKNHVVVSKNYVSLWDCENDRLVILTREAWKKIYGDNKN
jgi:hypothetical protein